MLRQAQAKQRAAIDRYNSAVRQHNQKVRRAVDEYNREVRAHNARVQANRQKLRSAIARLSSSTTTRRTVVSYRISVENLHRSYAGLETGIEHQQLGPRDELLVDLSADEMRNAVAVANALDNPDAPSDDESNQTSEELKAALRRVSPDLDARWTGAVFSLDPRNPDAARHFSASAREIFVRLIDIVAPEQAVLGWKTDAPRTPDGRVTRRARFQYALERQGSEVEGLATFAEDNIENIMELFRTLNDATHGSAGTIALKELHAIRRRVESGIGFVCRLAGLY